MVSTLVVVLSSGRDPWQSIESLGQRQTWARQLPPEVSVLWVRGRPASERDWYLQARADQVRRQLRLAHRVAFRRQLPPPQFPPILDSANRILQVDVPETLSWMGHRLIQLLSYALEFMKFDFLLRTNSSSYIDVTTLQSWLECLDDIPGYCGVPIAVNRRRLRLTYASGTAIGMSRQVVERVLNNPSSWRHDLIEDLALGVQMRKLGVPLRTIRRADVASVDDVTRLPPTRSEDLFAYRCKVDRNPFEAVDVMNALKKRLG